MYVYTTYTRPLSVQAQYSRSCPIISSTCYNSSLVTWTAVCLTAAKFTPLIFPVSRFTLSNVDSTFSTELFFITTLHGPNRKYRSQQLFYYWMCVRCRGYVLNKPLPSTGPLFWLHYSGLQASYHNSMTDCLLLLRDAKFVSLVTFMLLWSICFQSLLTMQTSASSCSLQFHLRDCTVFFHS
jgi:hypothetical protein